MRIQMLIRFILLFFCLSMMIVSAKAGKHENVGYFQTRQEDSKSTLASIENVNKASEQASQLLEDF